MYIVMKHNLVKYIVMNKADGEKLKALRIIPTNGVGFQRWDQGTSNDNQT